MKQIPIKVCNVYAVDFPSMVFRQLEKRNGFSQKKQARDLSFFDKKHSSAKKSHRVKTGSHVEKTVCCIIEYQMFFS